MFYSKSYYYFELIYQQRQVYRLTSEESCIKWIEVLNAAIIYTKFFMKIMENNLEVAQYFSKLKEETQYIDFDQKIDQIYKKPKQSNKNLNESANKKKEETKANKPEKKERRKNPHTNSNIGKIKY